METIHKRAQDMANNFRKERRTFPPDQRIGAAIIFTGRVGAIGENEATALTAEELARTGKVFMEVRPGVADVLNSRIGRRWTSGPEDSMGAALFENQIALSREARTKKQPVKYFSPK